MSPQAQNERIVIGDRTGLRLVVDHTGARILAGCAYELTHHDTQDETEARRWALAATWPDACKHSSPGPTCWRRHTPGGKLQTERFAAALLAESAGRTVEGGLMAADKRRALQREHDEKERRYQEAERQRTPLIVTPTAAQHGLIGAHTAGLRGLRTLLPLIILGQGGER